jgi:hypothetical protein
MSTAAFLSRWSRRKRRASAALEGAANHHHTESRGLRIELEAAANAGAGSEPKSDLANLVPLEAIGAETDIRAFLAVGVPAELTQAALRRAWLSDPKIRDFVGLADYDWDFNTPGSMAGFGMIEATEQIERELLRLARGAAAVTTSEMPRSPPPMGERQAGDEGHSAAPDEDNGPARPDDVSPVQQSTGPAPRPEELAERVFRSQRKHGRALPR